MAGTALRRAGQAMTATESSEALIIGGGPAGAAAGTWLARSGREVEIVEQSALPHHKVCGEFLSYESVEYLSELGVDVAALGAEQILGVRLARRTRIAECELPFPAVSLTRCRLDEALLAAAKNAGARIRRGRRVESMQKTESGWRALLNGGEALCSREIFLATGKHDVKDYRRPRAAQNDLIAFKMYFRMDPAQREALRGWVELVLFPGGYAGLQLNECGDANLCLLVSRRRLGECDNSWRTLLEHILRHSDHLAERLSRTEPLLEKPLALSSIPYGMLLAHSEPGLWRIGDQAAVTPSFSGDGISIALHSARLAADLYTNGGAAAEFTLRLHRDLRAPIATATLFSRLMVSIPWLAPVLRAWPPLLRTVAEHTRVPANALMAR
jgi:flavin-dependent dehydrogenase